MSKLNFPPAETLTLADGRVLGYTVYGDAAATSRTVFYQHWFPGSRYEAATWDAGARGHGIRLVAADRPGCGASTNQPNRTLLDWPADILALASHLGAAKFGILGVSGGGPYTLALLHALPATQCAGAAVVAGAGPDAEPPGAADGDGLGGDEDEDDEDNVMGAGDDDADDVTLDPATTILFASPPWGGPGYSTDAIFDLSTMEPYALARLHAAYRAMDHALYLPRTSDLRQIARLAPAQPAHPGKAEEQEEGGSSSSTKEKKKKKKKIEVVQYCVEGASKALVAYIPAVTTTREEEEQERQGQQRDGDSGLERAMELD